ncbi:MAG: HAD hydrolase-like protein [Xanthomonadaceae bacterium]|nr:HAD hydrolase-like protein [Rhodospirillaceae bacterium]NIA18060.1 HAD hydrolase-like protein [Xanthomonadaceae bacterium]
MKKVLIFDYDGVIVDSLNFAMKIFNYVCKKHKINKVINKDEFIKLFDKNFYKSVAELEIFNKKIPFLVINDFKKYFKLYQGKIKLFKDIKIILKQLSKNNDIFIVTSNSTKTVKDYLLYHNINYIKEVSGVENGISKDQKILLIKKKYFKEKIYYIGDTKGDIIEGEKAGVETVGVTWGYHSKERILQARPDFIIDSPKELIELFK